MSFSGYCLGPKLFVHLVMIHLQSNVVTYDFTSNSADAFDEAYGLDGFNLYSSFALSCFKLPKTSSVEICINFFFSFLICSRILKTPTILESINGFAFNWLLVIKNEDGNSFYVDIDNIKKHNGLVYYWELIDLLEPLQSTSEVYNSVINKYKVNCGEEKKNLVEF